MSAEVERLRDALTVAQLERDEARHERDELREAVWSVLEAAAGETSDESREWWPALLDVACDTGFRCPDCDGQGVVGVVRDAYTSTCDPGNVDDVTCETCSGRGWARPRGA